MRNILAVAAVLMAFTTTPALAVTDGALDGNGHPAVGLMVAKNALGAPLWRCSGGQGLPSKGEVSGTTYTHPLCDPAAFWRYDLGVVVLDEAVELPRTA